MNGSATWIKVAIALVPILVYLISIGNKIDTTAQAVQAHATDTAIQIALARAICRHGARNPSEMQFCDSVGLPSAP